METSYGYAICEAIKQELLNNEKSYIIGQDIEDNLYGYTAGIKQQFGPERIKNTPLSEAATMGTAIGSAMCGLNPIIDLTVSSFLYVAMDQIVSMASKTTYMYDGQYKLPMTIMCSSMYGANNSSQHSDRPHPIFMGIPGLKVICPATVQDAYSLHRAAFKDPNPVLIITDRSLFYEKADIDISIIAELGQANLINTGKDITIVSISGALKLVNQCNEFFNRNNISAEIIDVRSLVPFDKKTIIDSVKKTGRILIVDTANRTCSAASNISSIIAEEAFNYLKSPIGIVSYDDVPVPFSTILENQIKPTTEKIINKINYMLGASYE